MVKLLGIGNPLLDISVHGPHELLDKYSLKAGNAILAGPEHMPLFEEMLSKYQPTYIAGGATQNSIRAAQWMLNEPGQTAFIGCVGNDDYAAQLEKVGFTQKLDFITLQIIGCPKRWHWCALHAH